MYGFGLRPRHYADVLARGMPASTFEIIAENVMGRGGRLRAVVDRARRDAPVLVHGVSLSLGGVDPFDPHALTLLRALVDELQPLVVSDHLCFSGAHGFCGHDLWPLPATEESVRHTAARIRQVQDRLGRRIAVENVSSYVRLGPAELEEWELLSAVAAEADCGILLDLNNIVVNAANHGFDPLRYLRAIDGERVVQLHLAGHSDCGSFLLDDHGSAPPEGVLALFDAFVARHGERPTILEWDDEPPDAATLTAHLERVRARARRVLDMTAGGSPARSAA